MTDAGNRAQGKESEVDSIALRPGQTVGRLEIVSVLGQGGFGITYRARDTQLKRDIALKEYLPVSLADRHDGTMVRPRSTKFAEDFTWGRDRFVAEGQTLASLHHAPAIVRVFDFLEANGTAYIVMELLSGETLEHRVRTKGPLSPSEIDQILWPMLDGLKQVHDTGFLHRDIKPANILLNADGKPTLIDFGASRAAIAGQTTAMTAIFTPGYAAPEQFTSAKQGPWTDIYGVAATMYYAITGETPANAFDRMLDDVYKPLADLQPSGFSRSLLLGIDAGLRLRAGDRPQSIEGWQSLLGRTLPPGDQATVMLGRNAPEATVVMRSSPTTAPPKEGPTKRNTGIWIGLSAAVAALLAAGYFFATDKVQTRQSVVSPPAPAAITTTEADGPWTGTFHCSANQFSSDFTVKVQFSISGGAGTWSSSYKLGSSPYGTNAYKIDLKIAGSDVVITRTYVPSSEPDLTQTATTSAHFDGKVITGGGAEYKTGRNCEIALIRTP
jgi:serine/threonine protein kinase